MSAELSVTETDALTPQAELIRASGVLGRPGQLTKLFDFLVESSRTDSPVKEATIAIDVFGKDGSFDVAQDALVRVYVHKLRRKLEDFYVAEGRAQAVKLVIPRGNYSLTIEPNTAPVLPFEPVQPTGMGAALSALIAVRKFRMMAVAALLAAAALGFTAATFWRDSQDDLRDVRAHPLWATLMNNGRPINIVVGDFYIFGDTQDSAEIKRMVREFDVNSRADLDQLLMNHPELAARYVDMDLQYLPTGSAFALRDVMLVLAPAKNRIRVMQMSDFNPEVLRSENVIYIGFLSGLGMLRDSIFERSRFVIGQTYDEIKDQTTGTLYASGEGSHLRNQSSGRGETTSKYRDFGYVSAMPGPNGNQIVALAGTRDVGLMQLSSMVTQAEPLAALQTPEMAGMSSAAPAAFEALYQVTGINRTNLEGKLVVASALKMPKTQ